MIFDFSFRGFYVDFIRLGISKWLVTKSEKDLSIHDFGLMILQNWNKHFDDCIFNQIQTQTKQE